jgi:tRNA dimethylallyltransferase
MNEDKKTLVVIVGPTAVGKTSLSIKLAKHFKTEIISADSRQVYREMEKGTAKPSLEELTEVTHHFINSHSITDNFNAAEFEKEALKLLDQLFLQYHIVIAVGGSGLYVDALCKGMDDIPAIDPSVREELNLLFEKEGIESLRNKLKELDPAYYSIVDLHNPQRLIRALEVCVGTGKRYSEYRKKHESSRPFHIVKIGLEIDREELYKRIDLRMDKMIEEGLFEEAKAFYPQRHLNALQTVGYTEIFNYLNGEYDKEEAIRLLKRNSRRYAKRQLTWFRRDEEVKWFQAGDFEEVVGYLSNHGFK